MHDKTSRENTDKTLERESLSSRQSQGSGVDGENVQASPKDLVAVQRLKTERGPRLNNQPGPRLPAHFEE